MTREKFSTEKTPEGMQFVIPGTEKPQKVKRQRFKVETTDAGDQYVIPGADRIGTGEYLNRLVLHPLQSGKKQLPANGTPLFR